MRVSHAAFGSITLGLYVGCVGCLPLPAKGCTSASQGALGPLAVMSKRGACSMWLDDGTSGRTNLQNAFVGRKRGIACLIDCYVWLGDITCAYGCAYARHAPHATRHTSIDNQRGGGVPGCGCYAWLFVRHAPRATHPYVARGWVGHCCGLLLAVQGRNTGKPRPSKYISVCFLYTSSFLGISSSPFKRSLFEWRSGV